MRGRGIPMSLRGVGGIYGRSKPNRRDPEAQSELKVRTPEPLLDDTAGSLKELQQKIGVVFRNIELLRQAFVHRSYLNERQGADLKHNERLEFLGDKVFGMALAQFLFRKLPDSPEGKMTAIFGIMAGNEMQAKIAEELNLDRFILMSRGERKDFDARKRSRIFIMSNVFEALIGAIFLDRGPGMVELFLQNTLFPRLAKVVTERQYLTPKGYLQEVAQANLSITPHYEVLSEKGPDHNKVFEIAAVCGDRHIGQGTGSSKALAETEAARDALQKEFRIVL